ncbi:cytochrome c oxidase assembly protein [uncultured Corynebacterium sp.]|uniref:cytochrome c oxidase assembly protein n=1 Tax=uncultured Corynebacterium sp. TaxID=159447 RepID=UPI0025FFF057|nr:cytochrome c oxidase assembly protein [uncultured Corynebacterium sp.]
MSHEPENPANSSPTAGGAASVGGDAVTAARPQASPRAARGSVGVYLVLGVIAGLAAGVISLFFLSDSLAALGIPDPGRLTTFGLPFLRAAAWIAMATCVGSYLVSAFLISPNVAAVGGNDNLIQAPLTVDGHIAARAGCCAAWIVAIISLVEVPLVMSDLTGTPLTGVLNSTMLTMALGQIATARVWAITALLAAIVGGYGFFARMWSSQPVLLVLALCMVIPLGMEGHSAAGGDHDYGTNSFLWHLVFMVLWIGGLIGLLAHARRLGPDMPTAVRRYSALALFSVIVMSVSGLINAGVRIEFSDWFNTRYGLIIVAKVTLTLVLAFLGFAHRSLTIPQLESNPGLFRRVAFVELIIMAATVGVAGTMGRTPPPPPRNPNLNSMQILLGYELTEAPSAKVLFTSYRFDILFGTIGLLLAAGYIYAVVRVHRRGLEWSRGRTAWWLAGTLGLAWFMSSGFGIYIPALYSMHMIGHMVLSMALPVFMVLGAPLTLIMEAFPPNPEGRPGLHEWAVAATQSRGAGLVGRSAFNLIQYLVVFYALYMFPDFYAYAVKEHAGHVLMNVAFLVSGYVYFWELIGSDSLPRRRPTGIRLVLLFVSMPIHLYAGVYLMQLNTVFALDFYQSLDLPWNPDFLQDQKVGGGYAWGLGQFPLLIVFAYLFFEWLREDRRTARRIDAKADVDGNAELEDYNAMLAALHEDGDEQRYRAR